MRHRLSTDVAATLSIMLRLACHASRGAIGLIRPMTRLVRQSAVILALVLTALTGHADERAVRFDIPRQNAGDALPVFGEQADISVVYRFDQIKNHRTNRLKGKYPITQAVTMLLNGTGLQASFDSSGHLIVTQANNREKKAMQVEEGSLKPRGLLAAIIGAIIGAGGIQGAQAQQQESSDAERRGMLLEEIVVTAQRREERLQDVPISISVLGNERLERSGDSVIDQLGRVPGVAIAATPVGTQQLAVRGVSSTGDWFSGTGTVGYYLDSVPFGFVRQSFVPDSNAYDLDRVEILRGPQGTLYGVSALNGVVRVLTADPDLDKFELKTRALTSTTKKGGHGYRGDGAINVPLLDGKTAVRAVVSYEDNPGWVDGPTGKNINDSDNVTARIKLKAALTDNLSATGMVWHSESNAGGRSISERDRITTIRVPEESSSDYDIYALRAELELDAVSVTSATSYIDYSNSATVAFDVRSEAYLVSRFASNNFSQEIALNSNASGPLLWSVGAIYRDVKDQMAQTFSFPMPNPRGLGYDDYSKSYAIFGELSWKVLDNLTLSGGLRHFEDRNEVRQRENPIDPNAVLINNSEKFHRTSPRVALNWQPSSSLALYASYGEGFRSGFSQSPTILSQEPNFPGVKPDYLRNYEVGAKGDLLDGLLSFEAAFYFMDWQGVQQNTLVNVPAAGGTLNALINGDSASGVGTDLMLTVRPVGGLELGATYSWNDLTFDADVFTLVAGEPHVLAPKGSRLFNSPKESASFFMDYRFPIGNFDAKVSGSTSYTAARLQRAVIGGVNLLNTSDQVWMSRAAVDVSPRGNNSWSLTLFVDNLTDVKGVVSPLFPGQNMEDPAAAFRARPRTVGLQLAYKM